MSNIPNPQMIAAHLRIVLAGMEVLRPDLIALAGALEMAASQGETVAAVSLGDAADRVVERLIHR